MSCYVELKNLCNKGTSSIMQKDLEGIEGEYPIFGASGYIKNIDYYHQEREYIAVVKDGAGVGRVYLLPENSSVIGTLQYIIPNEDVDIKYLYYALTYANLSKYYTGATIPHIYFKDYCREKICFPDLNQQRIVAQTLGYIDSILEKRKSQLVKLGELLQSQFIEMFSSVEETTIMNHYIRYLIAGKSLVGVGECKNKVLKTGSVRHDYFDPSQHKYLPSQYTPVSEHLVKEGDVIISRMNTPELVGAAAYVWNSEPNLYLPDRLWKSILNFNVNPIFLWQLLIQPSTKESIQKISSGTSGSMKNISKSEFLKLRVKKVAFAQQNKFADFVRQVDKSKYRVYNSRKIINNLIEDIIHLQ